jgi:hypothetical protein
MSDDLPGLGELAAAAARISGAFHDIHGHRVTIDPRFARTLPALALIYGWTQQAFLYGRAAIPLVRDGDRAAVPLVRESFECGVRVQWMRWVPGSDIAMLRNDARTRRSLADAVSKLPNYPDFQESAAALIAQADENDEAAAGLSAPSRLPDDFQSVCGYFDQGDELYLYYRLLSLEAHPNATSADSWLRLDADDCLVFRNPPPADALDAQMLVMALTMASTGLLDVLRTNKATRRFRNTINSAASATGLLRTRLKPKVNS